jgi:hypothetical protein
MTERMMRDATFIWIVIDWAMKFLPTKNSESQADFFAKAGLPWHGISITWYCQIDKAFKHYYINQAVKDGPEDATQNIALVKQALRDHQEVYPQHVCCHVSSDGAGGYSGGRFFASLGLLFFQIGMKVESHTTGAYIYIHVHIYVYMYIYICIYMHMLISYRYISIQIL